MLCSGVTETASSPFSLTTLLLLATFAVALGIFLIGCIVQSLKRPSREAQASMLPQKETPQPLLTTSESIESTEFSEPPPTSSDFPIYQAPQTSFTHPTPPPLPVTTRWGIFCDWCRPIDLAGLALVFLIFSGFGLSSSMVDSSDASPTLSPDILISNILIFAFLVLMVVMIVWWRIKPAQWLGLRWKQWYHVFWIGPSTVLGMWIVLAILQVSGYVKFMESISGGNSTQDAVKLLRESTDNLAVGLMAFSAAIVAPIAEEVIFRGYLYPVAKKFSGIGIGMLFSSLVFAAGHGNVPLMLPLFLLGMIMAYSYEKTGSILAPISIHFCFNSATVLMQLAARSGLIDLPETA
jgi:membrane protease YdiL (CAAX protease family)